jgi:putative ABC transport system permease protein
MLRLAWKNIIHNPLNLLLSLILFGLGVGLISFLLLFDEQLKEKFDKNLAGIDLVAGAKGSPLQMILCNMYHIDNPTGNVSIKVAAPLLRSNHPLIKKAIPLSLGDNYKSYRIVGTNHDILSLYEGKLGSGALWKNDMEVTIGSSVATETGLKIGDEFISSHGFVDDADLAHAETKFVVKGILAESGSVLDLLILTNTATIWKVHEGHGDEASGEDHDHAAHAHADTTSTHVHDNSNEDLLTHPDKEITSILIDYKNPTNFQALNFGRNLNENTDMQAASPAIEMNRLYSMIGLGTDTIRALAILIAIVSALSIFLSLYRSMKERKYELALIRVMGGSKTKVFALILIEGLILALLGFLLGIAISHVGMEIMSGYLKENFRYAFTGWRWLQDEWKILGISLILGLIAALIPAVQASTTDINKTLSEK